MNHHEKHRDFHDLFGDIDFSGLPESRSVCSPCAYLVDLLKLVKRINRAGEFDRRRPDVKDLVLDAKAVGEPLPYLSIVNSVLEAATVAQSRNVEPTVEDPYQVLRTAASTSGLPFNLASERVNASLSAFGVAPTVLNDAFRKSPPDVDRIACDALGISEEMFAEIIAPKGSADPIGRLANCAGFSIDEVRWVAGACGTASVNASVVRTVAVLQRLRRECEISIGAACGLLDDLIEGARDLPPAQSPFHALFNEPWAAAECEYVPGDDDPPYAYADLEVIGRDGDLIASAQASLRRRLERALKIGTTQITKIVEQWRRRAVGSVDLFGRDGCVATGGLSLLHRVARLAEISDLSVDELFDLLDVLDFDPSIAETWASAFLLPLPRPTRDCWSVLAPAVASATEAPPIDKASVTEARLWLTQTVLATANWMRQCELSASELKAIAGLTEADEAAGKNGPDWLASLRERLVAAALTPTNFETDRFTASSARILLNALAAFPDSPLASRDPRIVCVDPQTSSSARAAALAAIALLGEPDVEDYRGIGLETRIVEKILRNLVYRGYVAADGRILSERVPENANEFTLSSTGDDLGLRLFDAIRDKVAQSTTEANGDGERSERGEYGQGDPSGLSDLQVVSGDFGANDYFSASDEFGAGVSDEFSAIDGPATNDVRSESDVRGNHNDVDDSAEAHGDVAFFRSDIVAAGIADELASEIYDDLQYRGVIDEEGRLPYPGYFADPANRSRFACGVKLEIFASAVHAKLRDCARDVDDANVLLDLQPLLSRGFNAGELDALRESLRFNGHLADSGHLLHPRKLATAETRDFPLGPNFLSRRAIVLAEIQSQLRADRERRLLVGAETLAPTVEDILARRVEAAVRILLDGRSRDEQRTILLNPAYVETLDAGTYFDATQRAAVFAAGRARTEAWRPYFITDETLFRAAPSEVALLPESVQYLREWFAKQGVVSRDGVLPGLWLDYFAVAENATEFSLPGFEDYSIDVFRAFHVVAVEVRQAADQILDVLKRAAEDQRAAVGAALQEEMGMDEGVVAVVLRRIFGAEGLRLDRFLPTVPTAGEQTAGAASAGVPTVAPPLDRELQRRLRFLRLFGRIATKFSLTATDCELVFEDQRLTEKFPEPLALPGETRRIDALLESADGRTYLFVGNQFWTYGADWRSPLAGPRPLAEFAPLLAGAARIDAAFRGPNGGEWIVGGGRCLLREANDVEWRESPWNWGRVRGLFDDVATTDGAEPPRGVDTVFVDNEGRTYLLRGDRYVRYSDSRNGYRWTDEGYPRRIGDALAGEFEKSGWNADLRASLDAVLQTPSLKLYLFRGASYVDADKGSNLLPIAERWSNVRNEIARRRHIDAALEYRGKIYVIGGDQVSCHSGNLELPDAACDSGSLRRLETWLPALPAAFHSDLSAAFVGADGRAYFFQGSGYASLPARALDGEPITAADVAEGDVEQRWGRVRNNIRATGAVDSAFLGLDGYTYLFSGDQYFRYSKGDYAIVDEGFPRSIAGAWGGLGFVTASFVLDGKTYLFGKDHDGLDRYVRYSTADYSQADAGYPRATDDNWWNLPIELVRDGFANPDAVFVGSDGCTRLFYGERFVTYETLQRVWSRPELIRERFDSLPFASLSAAFVGRDGRTYLFSGDRFARYSGRDYSRLDDRFPRPTAAYWGAVENRLQQTRHVDAALVLNTPPVTSDTTLAAPPDSALEAALDTTTQGGAPCVLLFSGDQVYRYSGDSYEFVDEGFPRRVRDFFREEPRLAAFSPDVVQRLDAACSDGRNVYLFAGDELHVASVADHVRVTLPAPTGIRCGFLDTGGVHVETADGWRRWGLSATTDDDATPISLRDVPLRFRSGIDAVLRGVDKNTYVFRGEECLNVDLGKVYPIAEEWGRLDNPVIERDSIDAVLHGRDGRIYVFSDDRFMSYRLDPQRPSAIPDYVDEGPAPILGRWGGVTNVRVAFIHDGVTYLVEHPDDEGRFRYVSYSTADYSRPDQDAPVTVDFSWWKLPPECVEAGFRRVDAAFVEGRNLFLFGERDFVQFDLIDRVWTHPKPIDRVWRGVPLQTTDFSTIRTVFQGPDRATYFFSDRKFVRYDPTTATAGVPRLVSEAWGRVANDVERLGRVDAACVIDGATYLFAGDHYVRYSSSNYRFVDPGYPKQIASDLRAETPFAALSADFAREFAELRSRKGSVKAVWADERSAFLATTEGLHVVAKSRTAKYSIERVARVPNPLAAGASVDASFIDRERRVVMVAGDHVYRFAHEEAEFVDEGFPRRIDQGFEFGAARGRVPAQYREFTYGLDAAFEAPDGRTYLFKGPQFLASGIDGAPASVGAIAEYWGRTRGLFDPGVAPQIDGAFTTPRGETYVFRGDRFARFTGSDLEYADAGFPAPVKDAWGDLPREFEQGVDGAFVLGDAVYLARGESYVRYSNADFHRVDATFPRSFAAMWRSRVPFALEDLRLLGRLKQLDEAGREPGGLVALLDRALGVRATPYERLAELFGWNVDDVSWLGRRHAFLTRPADGAPESIEWAVRTADVLALCAKFGRSPAEVYTQVWSRLYGAEEDSEGGGHEIAGRRFPTYASASAAADVLERWLAAQPAPPAGETPQRRARRALDERKRDALVAYLLTCPTVDDGHIDSLPTSARDLYERHLIDVEMSGEVESTRVLEAIAAVQLFLHRCLLRLEESAGADNDADDRLLGELKQWWGWMKNYRTWEANRKVFLYPENYLRPELRDTKTRQFKSLEERLAQPDVSPESYELAFKEYLDAFTEVSKLLVAGGCVYVSPDQSGDLCLSLFGRTASDPLKFYHRRATFVGGTCEGAAWQPWEEVGVKIDSPRVSVVHAFRRDFAFWLRVELDADEPPQTVVSKQDGDSTKTETPNRRITVLKIGYTYRKLSGEWAQAQTFASDIRVPGQVVAATLAVSVERDATSQFDRAVVVRCRWIPDAAALSKSDFRQFRLTADLYVAPCEDAAPFADPDSSILRNVSPDPDLALSEVVPIGTDFEKATGRWFALNAYGGGSLLLRPVSFQQASPSKRTIADALGATFAPPSIDAAFALDDDNIYYFNNASRGYFVKGAAQRLLPFASRWGRASNNLTIDGTVDAAVTLDKQSYLFGGDECFRCTETAAQNDDVRLGETCKLSDLPKWDRRFPGELTHVRGAFQVNGRLFVIGASRTNNETTLFDSEARPRLATTAFGARRNENTSRKIVAAFVWGAHEYVCGESEYLRINRDSGALEPLLPRTNRVDALLADVGIDVKKSIPAELASRPVRAARSGPDALLLWVEGTPGTGTRIILRNGQLELQPNQPRPATRFLIGDRLLTFDGLTVQETTARRDAAAAAEIPPVARILPAEVVAIIPRAEGGYRAFSRDRFVDCPPNSENPIRTLVETLEQWSLPRAVDKLWPLQLDPIGEILGAWRRGDRLYLRTSQRTYQFTSDDIATAPNRTPVSPLDPDPQLAAGAPSSKTEPQTVLDAGDRTFVFVGETFRSANEPKVWKPTRECWGANANLITKEGVDAAYVDSSHLVLIRRDEYVRYTRGADGRIPLTIDPGYPKKTKLPFSVDSALSLDFADGGGRLHFLFANGIYTRVKPSEELCDVAPPIPQPLWFRDMFKQVLSGALRSTFWGLPFDRWSTVQGHWENFPASLAYRFDAATTTSEGVRMFCGQDCWQFFRQSPPHESANLRYEVSRLATSTANALHQALLSGGMPGLLSPETQEVDETPRLTLAATVTGDPAVQFDASFVNTTTLPTSDHLDFDGPNGRYYWEVFFHAPWLVAQRLNAAGKYEQAKRWFEFVFDPAGADTCWRFKPFDDDRDELSPTSAAWASQWKAYHDDPFDPFAIADLRRAAYRRAFAMAYVDNLLDWGDELFAQFTQESLAEARMLYVLAYDLLGRRPATGNAMAAGPSRSYAQLLADGGAEAATPASSKSSTLTPSSPETVAPPNWSRSPRALVAAAPAPRNLATRKPAAAHPSLVHVTIGDPYFIVPENTRLLEYWDRVEDRLFKIRHGYDLRGQRRVPAMFEPPLNPLALVEGAASAAGGDGAAASGTVAMPLYRFEYLLGKTREFVGRLDQLASDLLVTLEKKDAEELARLQVRHEGIVQSLSVELRQSQIAQCEASLRSLEAARSAAKSREKRFQSLLDAGMLPAEIAQISLMTMSAGYQMAGGGIQAVAAIARVMPQTKIGPFILGVEAGGENLGEALQTGGGALQAIGQAVSVLGEILGMSAQHERMKDDWRFEIEQAKSEQGQLDAQIDSSKAALQQARQDLALTRKLCEQNEEVQAFYRGKFTNGRLYEWMAGRIAKAYGGLHSMALDLARSAERAFRFELGIPDGEPSFLTGGYWDSSCRGLTAAESLGADLDRLEKSYLDRNTRGLEVTRRISLAEVAPLALLDLRRDGRCEFELTEALFDADFPGHYRRQIRTIAVTFQFGDQARMLYATLTQLSDRVVIAPDVNAVKFMLEPRDAPPASIRGNWRGGQNVVLSDAENHEKNNGLFDTRFAGDRYLPFEGTGAVSRWRLELNGRRACESAAELTDVSLELQYVARSGGEAFAKSVRGLLKPRPVDRLIDVAGEFPDAWRAFQEATSEHLVLDLDRGRFPGIVGGKVQRLLVHAVSAAPSATGVRVLEYQDLVLPDSRSVETPGMTIGPRGARWTLELTGDRRTIDNLLLVVTYRAKD